MGDDPKSIYWKGISEELIDRETSHKNGCRKRMANSISFPTVSSHSRLLCSANLIIQQQLENKGLQIDRYLNSNWENIGNLVTAWGCANPPQYA